MACPMLEPSCRAVGLPSFSCHELERKGKENVFPRDGVIPAAGPYQSLLISSEQRVQLCGRSDEVCISEVTAIESKG